MLIFYLPAEISSNPKAKKNSHLKARDYENSVEQYEDAKSGKKKSTISEKELSKVTFALLYVFQLMNLYILMNLFF